MNKLVRESISFERSKDPKQTMGISKLEKIKKDLDIETSDINTILLVSIYLKYLPGIKYAISKGKFNMSVKKEAVNRALIMGYPGILKYLINHNFDINYGDSALIVFNKSHGSKEMQEFLENLKINNE